VRRPGVTAIARAVGWRLIVRSGRGVLRFVVSPDVGPDELERIAVATAWAFDVPLSQAWCAVEGAVAEVRP